MYLKLMGHRNPGLNLTEERKEDLRLFLKWIKDNANKGSMTYKEIQEAIGNDEVDLNPSEIRMLAPFLNKAGYIKDVSRGENINLTEYITNDGEIFYRYLTLRSNVNNSLSDEKIMEKLDELISVFFMVSILKKGTFIICKKCIEFLSVYESMDEEEFCFMTTLDNKYGYGTEVYKNKLNRLIAKYRKGKFEGKIQIVKDVNGYQYISGLLIQCGVVLADGERRIKINNKYWYIYKTFINLNEVE